MRDARAGLQVVFLDLSLGEAHTTLRLDPDPEQRRRALSHGAGFGLSHLELAVPEAIRAGLSRLAAAFGRAGAEAPNELIARQHLQNAVAEVFPSAKLSVRRRVPEGQRTPHWPVRIRSGVPDITKGRLWPYDAELAGLELGVRRLLLREYREGEEANADVRWLRDRGLEVRRVETDGGFALFASRNPAVLAEAPSKHRLSCEGSERFEVGAHWMGEALGYPPCCVEAFVRVRSRNDAAMFAELLAPPSSPPSTPLTGFLVSALALVSHAPCKPDCPKTIGLSRRVLDELERRSPGFAGRWISLARRMHAIDEQGRCLAIALDEGMRVMDAVEIAPPTGDDGTFDGMIRSADELRAAELALIDAQLTSRDGRFCAGLFADQRGEVG